MLYTVKPGDTLGTIAARFLGSSARYMEIFSANQGVINNTITGTRVLSSPDVIEIGDVLEIPGTAPSAAQTSNVVKPLSNNSSDTSEEEEKSSIFASPVGIAVLAVGGALGVVLLVGASMRGRTA